MFENEYPPTSSEHSVKQAVNPKQRKNNWAEVENDMDKINTHIYHWSAQLWIV